MEAHKPKHTHTEYRDWHTASVSWSLSLSFCFFLRWILNRNVCCLGTGRMWKGHFVKDVQQYWVCPTAYGFLLCVSACVCGIEEIILDNAAADITSLRGPHKYFLFLCLTFTLVSLPSWTQGFHPSVLFRIVLFQLIRHRETEGQTLMNPSSDSCMWNRENVFWL